MSSDCDEEEEDQVKDKDSNQKQPQTNQSFSTTTTITLNTLKPFITKYFNSISRKTSIMYTLKDECRCDTIIPQKE